MPDSDPLAAELDAIRDRYAPLQWPGIGLELMLHGLRSAEDVPPMERALRAVLELHQASVTSNGVRVCGRCSRESGGFVPEWRCLVRTAIERELSGQAAPAATGEGGSDD